MKCKSYCSIVVLMAVVSLTACIACIPAYAAVSEAVSAGTVEMQPVNINTATVEDLQTVRGIGPKLATRIVSYRDEHGSFTTIEDVMQVNGIGSAKYEKIKDALRV